MALANIKDRVDDAFGKIIDTARDLISIPSRNPPGEERRCAEYIYSNLKERYEHLYNVVLLHKPFEHRPQVVMYPKDGIDRVRVVLNGHIDTVPEGDYNAWHTDPFSATIKDGYLYGRGSVDMKSSLAVMMHIVDILQEHEASKSIALMFAVGEERAEGGTYAILEYMKGLGLKAKYGLVLEPTALKICYAQQGALWLRVKVKGKATHASLPEHGINAIEHAARAVDALSKYADSLRVRAYEGCIPRCSVTMLRGGIKENVIPDECELVIDRRLGIKENHEHVRKEVEELLNSLRLDYKLDIMARRDSVLIDKNSHIVEQLYDACKELGIDTCYSCFPASTDNEYLVKEGIESIVWGAGSLENAHAIDEHISIKELKYETYALALMLARLNYSMNLSL
jgi:succinyl-diaminopimelate desuccinylase